MLKNYAFITMVIVNLAYFVFLSIWCALSYNALFHRFIRGLIAARRKNGGGVANGIQ